MATLFVVFYNLVIVMFQYFEHIEEMEWAIEVCKETGKATVATMCIGPEGDLHGISAGDCAVRMAKAGKCTFLRDASISCTDR